MYEDQMGWGLTLSSYLQQPHLDPRSFLKTGHWVSIHSNQKVIKYISASSISSSAETRPVQLHDLLYFPPALPS